MSHRYRVFHFVCVCHWNTPPLKALPCRSANSFQWGIIFKESFIWEHCMYLQGTMAPSPDHLTKTTLNTNVPFISHAKLQLFAARTLIIWYYRVWPCLLSGYPGTSAWQLLAYTRKAGKGLGTWDVVGSVAWQQAARSAWHTLPLGVRERVAHSYTPWWCFISLYCS